VEVLRDVLTPGLKVVFCGTAAGNRSKEVGAYYAGRGNLFWDVLFRVGLTPRKLEPQDFLTLPDYHIGLTDLAKHRHGNDDVLQASDFDREGLRSRIAAVKPLALAFNGKRAAKEFDGSYTHFGRQANEIEGVAVFVLPSTSGMARKHWEESYWRDLAAFVKQER
jgi:TDG/mug DNA glycosylase family protein